MWSTQVVKQMVAFISKIPKQRVCFGTKTQFVPLTASHQPKKRKEKSNKRNKQQNFHQDRNDPQASF